MWQYKSKPFNQVSRMLSCLLLVKQTLVEPVLLCNAGQNSQTIEKCFEKVFFFYQGRHL